MAMEALRNLPNRLRQAMDTINRKDTIEAIQQHFNPTGEELPTELASVLAGVGVVIGTMPPSPTPNAPKTLDSNTQHAQGVKSVEKTQLSGEDATFDCISRQSVIDAIEGVDWYHINKDGQLTHGANSKEDEPLYKAKDVYAVLNEMPSAQPEKRTEERTETHACDLISRQAAIDAHYEYCNKHPDAGFPVWSLKILKDLPSAQPEVLAYGEGELSAQPEIVLCKDCKHWKDSDGVYRRGIGAESKCPVNIRAVYEGNFYCADAERRTDET